VNENKNIKTYKFNILNERKKHKKVIHIFSLAQPPYFTQIEEFSQFQDLINYMKN